MATDKLRYKKKGYLYAEVQGFELAWLIHQLRRLIHKSRSRELTKYGITPEESAVLFVLHSMGGKSTPIEISRWLMLEPHSVSQLIQRMERKGLVKKVKDLGRKNLVRVAFTKMGRQAYLMSAERKVTYSILGSLSDEEYHQLRSCLERLRNQVLKKLGETYTPTFPPSVLSTTDFR